MLKKLDVTSPKRYSPLCSVYLQMYVLSGWALATAMGLAVVYGADVEKVFFADLSEYTTEAKNIAYGGLHRLTWGVALAWMAWACIKGYGG